MIFQVEIGLMGRVPCGNVSGLLAGLQVRQAEFSPPRSRSKLLPGVEWEATGAILGGAQVGTRVEFKGGSG